MDNALFAVTQLAQTTMRSDIGKISLDKTFEERDTLNRNIVEAIRRASHRIASHRIASHRIASHRLADTHSQCCQFDSRYSSEQLRAYHLRLNASPSLLIVVFWDNSQRLCDS